MPKVVVIGAGAIGLASAYELRRRGAEVVVLDMGNPGEGSSEGNAGWITPSIATPLPAPGLVSTSLKWMLKKDSPLYIKPRVNPAFIKWLWTFWRHCRPAPYEAGVEAFTQLTPRTMSSFDDLQANGVKFEMHQSGLLFLGYRRENLQSVLDTVSHLSGTYGYKVPTMMNSHELLEMDPALGPGLTGFLVEEERHIRPDQLSASLVEWLEERHVEIRSGTRVTGLEKRGSRITGVRTNDGTFEADQVLLAAGAWTGALAKRWGYTVPIEAGKGYSITWQEPEKQLKHPIDLVEARVAITPFNNQLRFAGTMELSGLNTRLDPVRIEAIRRGGNQILGNWSRGKNERVWAGMRPLTPDGLPVFGLVPKTENLYVNSGHQMLGITFAPVSGELMAKLMYNEHIDIDMAPFDPARFVRR